MSMEHLTDQELRAFRAIRNSILHKGRSPLVRELMVSLDYRSPRSVSYMLERLEEKGFISRPSRGRVRLKGDLPGSDSHAQTINLPLLGSAPCGAPAFAEENIEAHLPVSTALARPPYRYFLLRVTGDSMTERGIFDGNLVLVRQQPTAQNGDPVVALIDGEATIKEFHRGQKAIVLKPRSMNPDHKPIILTDDFQVLGVVKSVIDL